MPLNIVNGIGNSHKHNFRRRIKAKLVQAFGGKCCCCGYEKSLCSLTFHHLDPMQKEFTIGKVRLTEDDMEKLIIEARKCVMVCNNCHAEIEAGLTGVPETHPEFNEKLFRKFLKDLKKNIDNL
ncbi:MAG: hypothetical protein M0P12_04500 [Paludibacteraceae bacterium]|nr:hypothetical protein [Paludibacteraceae bacterium]